MYAERDGGVGSRSDALNDTADSTESFVHLYTSSVSGSVTSQVVGLPPPLSGQYPIESKSWGGQ